MTTRALAAEPAVLAFALPKAVRESTHGIEGMHLHVEESGQRWDFVAGGSVYRFDSSMLQTMPAEGSRFGIAFGAMATSSSTSR
jgi:hypothetical protein